MEIAANYGNKHMKRPINIENSSDNDLEKLIRKKKLPPESRLPSFLINATMFLGKECILLLNSIAITSEKGVKCEYFITTHIPDSIDFHNVEGVIAHLDECSKKGIQDSSLSISGICR